MAKKEVRTTNSTFATGGFPKTAIKTLIKPYLIKLFIFIVTLFNIK